MFKSIYIKFLGIFLLLSLLFLSTLSTVQAVGLVVGPTKLELKDVFRGEEYEKTIIISNPDKNEGNFSLSAIGEAKEWISFYPLEEPTQQVTSLTIPGNSISKVLVKFQIPEDTPSGKYNSTIYVQCVPNKEGGMTLKMPIQVIIEVTGEQILTGKVERISTMDVETNYPLRIKVLFENTGNVIAKPEIKVDIIKDGEVVDSFTYLEAKVKPNSRESISVEWDTTGKESGSYEADVSVSLGGELIDKKTLSFELLPVGALTRKGSLIDLTYQGEALVGRLIKLLPLFENTGEIDTKAMFTGEVYCDGTLVNAIDSDELLIPVNEKDTLTTYLTIEAPGNYTLKGYVLYEGKKTDIKELSFIVPNAEATTSITPSTIATQTKQETQPLPLLEIAIIITILIIIAILVSGKRSK